MGIGPMDMRDVERRVARAFFADGMFECLSGVMLALMGVFIIVPPLATMLYMPWLLLTVIFPAARKRYITPRTGYVASPGGRSRQRLMLGLTVLLLVGLLFFAIGFADRQSPWIQTSMNALGWVIEHAPLVLGLGLAAFWGVMGWRTGLGRMLAYGVSSLLGAIAFSVVRLRLGLRAMALLVAVGAVMGIWGFVVLIRFLKTHPLPAPDGPEAPEGTVP
ncbi:MAG: hypothetical protein JXA74_14315 [Anaerolineae bacterium]|nr:hypothetical protein [Anaerolineae bacterium]